MDQDFWYRFGRENFTTEKKHNYFHMCTISTSSACIERNGLNNAKIQTGENLFSSQIKQCNVFRQRLRLIKESITMCSNNQSTNVIYVMVFNWKKHADKVYQSKFEVYANGSVLIIEVELLH